MADSRDVMVRAEMLLERLRETPAIKEARARRLKRKARNLFNRVLRMLAGMIAVAIGAIVFSQTVMPLGIFGFVIVVPLLMLLVAMLLARFPRSRAENEVALAKAALPALPPRLEEWLDSKRPSLPAPARNEVDRILLELDSLAPQLGKLPAGSREAADARRLMAEHLPRLVDSYEAVPARVRLADREADRQLIDGLRVVGDELERLSHRLASGSLDALEIEGRFLESRYRDTPRLGN
ncbi:MAG: hypothetical protein SNJ63_08895 [Sphingomonadaceae bacterium]